MLLKKMLSNIKLLKNNCPKERIMIFLLMNLNFMLSLRNSNFP